MNDKQITLIEDITTDIIGYLVEDYEITITEAMQIFYNTRLCHLIYDERNQFYLEGSGYLYELLKDELRRLQN